MTLTKTLFNVIQTDYRIDSCQRLDHRGDNIYTKINVEKIIKKKMLLLKEKKNSFRPPIYAARNICG